MNKIADEYKNNLYSELSKEMNTKIISTVNCQKSVKVYPVIAA